MDRDAAVDVGVTDAAGGQSGHDFGGISVHTLDDGAGWGRSKRPGAEHEHRFVAIGPFAQAENRLEGMAAHDQGIHGGHELFESMRLGVGGEEIEIPVAPRDKAIEADADKHRGQHAGFFRLRELHYTAGNMIVCHADAESDLPLAR